MFCDSKTICHCATRSFNRCEYFLFHPSIELVAPNSNPIEVGVPPISCVYMCLLCLSIFPSSAKFRRVSPYLKQQSFFCFRVNGPHQSPTNRDRNILSSYLNCSWCTFRTHPKMGPLAERPVLTEMTRATGTAGCMGQNVSVNATTLGRTWVIQAPLEIANKNAVVICQNWRTGCSPCARRR